LCESSVTTADLVATWAALRGDATGGLLATDALQLAIACHWLWEDLATALESEVVA
jgi:hypothetical protein